MPNALIKKPHSTIAISELIRLSFAYMGRKKSRTAVTVGGMAIGIGAIVFLVSVGHGLQDLVISRVAKLEELRQINIAPQQGSTVALHDATLSTIKGLAGVEKVLPLISVVGRVSYENSTSDVAAFGVTTDYLKTSATQPSSGRLFDNNSTTIEGLSEPRVLGIKADNEAESSPTPIPRASSGTLKLVELEGESGSGADEKTEQVAIASNTPREAVVNRQFLQVLGLEESTVIDKKFSVSFVVVSSLLQDVSKKIESVSEQYTIVGVIPEDQAPAIYVPFIDLRSIGITSYSQAKIITDKQEVVQNVRSAIEAMGFTTSSVLDTVEQINSFFATAQIALAIVGSVALLIASLGMFNTLTVSLLERTHEVGLMKAIGMKSREVQKLFLVESLTMGFLGGIFGLLLGYIAGWIASAVLTSVALTNGAGTIAVASVPLLLVVGVMLLALIVGVVTGIYPARRATKISPLDALRYE